MNLTIVGVTNTSITLHITPVEIMQQNGLIISYTFICQKINSTSNFTFTTEMNNETFLIENVTTVADLEVYTVYNISVYPSTIVGDGPEMSLQLRTNEGSK